ncbi:actin cytoskeleton and mitosis protein [Lithohypha guttulata]|uniref:actin cytoskeleton and mitosis protein n=1 Tax=Lithohypha guttulata TaxID=1690604 RepID=UPI002DDF3988|nr:actin cytoskeleton and mitosis protein [Lithohypha guttulata]
MCDEKERVERIFQNAVEPEETISNPNTGHPVTVEGRMVKKFRRAAAGAERQIPEELRTPATLKKTLNYLLKNVMGQSDRYGKHHKFVWDRTRAIRNDFNIQSFTKPQDVKYEVDCYERIVRFHILSLHIMSDPDQQKTAEEYNRQQELEQLQKTFASLIDKYDTFGRTMHFRNEPEFRAYYILFVARTTLYDLDTFIQRWPRHVLDDGRVQTALKLHAAASSIDYPTGSPNLDPIPPSIAQANAGAYWTLLQSKQVGYLMACVAEISFQLVRFTAINALWQAAKTAPEKGQSAMRAWSKPVLTEYLGFDYEEQTVEFCGKLEISFAKHPMNQEEYLDFQSNPAKSLERIRYNPSEKSSQVFSEAIVEQKRQGRTFTAVLNGFSIAAAIRAGMIADDAGHTPLVKTRNGMFVQDDDDDQEEEEDEEQQDRTGAPATSAGLSSFNPQAASFNPGSGAIPQSSSALEQPSWMSDFGASKTPETTHRIFGLSKQEQPTTSSAAIAQPLFQSSNSEASQKPFQFPTVSTATTTSNPSPTFPTSTQPAAAGSSPTTSAFITTSITEATQSATASRPLPNFSSFSPTSTTATYQPAQSDAAPAKQPIFSLTSTSADASSESAKPLFNLGQTAIKASAEDQTEQAGRPIFDSLKPTSGTILSSASESSSTIFDKPEAATTASTAPFKFNFASQPASVQEPLPASSGSARTSQSSATGSSGQFASSANLQATSDTTSQPPAHYKRPFFADTNFTQVPSLSDKAASTTPTHPAQKGEGPTFHIPPPLAQSTPIFNPNAPGRPPVATTVPEPSVTPAEPDSANEEQLLEHLCRIGTVQSDGILDMYIRLSLPRKLQDIFSSWTRKSLIKKTSVIEKKIRARKFFVLWKSIVDQRRLRRRADKRRRLLAETAKAEQQRRKHEEDEAARIVEAAAEKRRVQEEVQKRKDEQRQLKEEQKRLQAQQMRPPVNSPAPQAGQKRKTLTNSASRSNLQGIAMSPMHKRSRTVGSQSTEMPALGASSSSLPPLPLSASRTEHNGLRRSLSHKSLRQSLTQQRLDQTQTDYFRLKAMGVDPETPFVPDTAATLAAKKQKQEDHQAAVNERVIKRPSSTLNRSRTSTPSSPPRFAAVTSSRTSLARTSRPAPQAVAHTEATDDDPFLKSLREAREALSQDANWFKTQAVDLEKQVEQQEEFRRSLGSASSKDEALVRDAAGFSKSLNGFEYVPPEVRPGQTLSRTEQRIRRTGARGLANKPIGGSGPSSPHPLVPMSRRSASSLRNSQTSHENTNGASHGRKRSFDEVGLTVQHDVHSLEPSLNGEVDNHATKKVKSTMSLQGLQALARNPFGNGDYDDSDKTEEVEEGYDEEEYDGKQQYGEQEYDQEEYEDEEEEEFEDGRQVVAYPKISAYYEEGLDDAEDEEEVPEDEESEEDDGGDYTRSRYRQPGAEWNGTGFEDERLSLPRQDSRAVSTSAATPDTGHGSTVNDAIELSD